MNATEYLFVQNELKRLDDEHHSNFVMNVQEVIDSGLFVSKISDDLIGAFNFDHSPQGYEYWWVWYERLQE